MADHPEGAELEALRAELAAVDREIIGLAARRERLAAAIGRLKRESGLPARDFDQERVVLERARAIAREVALRPRIAEGLLLLLIESSLTTQEEEGLREVGRREGQRALVIGGAGRMGGWFARFLASQGFAVEVADPRGEAAPGRPSRRDWREGPLDHDLIVVATPLRPAAAVLAGLAARRPPGLIFDIGSLKGPLRSGLLALRESGAKVTSIHPMFGPDTELLSGRHVVFVDVGDAAATAEAQGLFASTMAVPVTMSLEEHDRVISYVLGLSHAVNIAFFSALAESGQTAPRLAELSSSTFDQQLGVAVGVAAENPRLYYEIQHLNEYGLDSLSALLRAVERLRSVVTSGDEEGFVALMERGRAYLERRRPVGEQARGPVRR